MYRQYYGFSEQPFDITPDPNFLYLSQSYEEALRAIIYGIQNRRGIIVIVGEVGTGKTLLLNTALEWLSKKTKVANVVNFNVSFKDLLVMALADLGLVKAGEKPGKAEALRRLDACAKAQITDGGNVALLVDEAQILDWNFMENLRLLSNMETAKHKLVQIVLSGQPELEAKLDQPELRQLAQRIGIRRYLHPLTESESYEYIRHRLTMAGLKRSSLFSNEAKALIWRFSAGIPRKINILCDNALLIGFQQLCNDIDETIVQKAVNDLRWKAPEDPVTT